MKESRIQSIITKIQQYKKEIDAMDMDVRLYLTDKDRYSHPQHEKLLDEIYRLEREIHGFNNPEVQFRLEGLLDSVMIHKRIWERWFDEDEEKHREEMEEQNKLVDIAYKTSEDLWAKQRVDPAESKQKLTKRIVPEYIAAKKFLKEGQKIVLTYDKMKQKINIKVKQSV